MALLTLDQLIVEACEIFAPADAPTRYHQAALTHAHAFRRAYIKNNPQELKTAYIQLASDRTAELPEDYGQWTMLGLTFPGWGVIRNLIYNSSIPLANLSADFSAFATPTVDYLTPPTTYECEQARHGLLDDGYEGYCGFGVPGYVDGFRIDHENHRIVCNSRVPESALLVLEYYGFAAADGEDISIDPLAWDWGQAFIIERLHAQKKDWASVNYWKAEVTKFREKYRSDKSTFTGGSAMKTNHEIAGQKWK